MFELTLRAKRGHQKAVFQRPADMRLSRGTSLVADSCVRDPADSAVFASDRVLFVWRVEDEASEGVYERFRGHVHDVLERTAVPRQNTIAWDSMHLAHDGSRVTLWYDVAVLRLFLVVLHAALGVFRARADLVIENIALRQQLAIFKQKQPRPSLSDFDRIFWVLLRRLWSRWIDTLIVVKPETVVRWHREG